MVKFQRTKESIHHSNTDTDRKQQLNDPHLGSVQLDPSVLYVSGLQTSKEDHRYSKISVTAFTYLKIIQRKAAEN